MQLGPHCVTVLLWHVFHELALTSLWLGFSREVPLAGLNGPLSAPQDIFNNPLPLDFQVKPTPRIHKEVKDEAGVFHVAGHGLLPAFTSQGGKNFLSSLNQLVLCSESFRERRKILLINHLAVQLILRVKAFVGRTGPECFS